MCICKNWAVHPSAVAMNNFYVHAIKNVSIVLVDAMEFQVRLENMHQIKNLTAIVFCFSDCQSMEDEQNCSGSTPSYCRVDYFRCGSTCIPNVSRRNKRKSITVLNFRSFFFDAFKSWRCDGHRGL